ncbi:MAG: FHA domain-containing protein [Actinomycetes bacterium]
MPDGEQERWPLPGDGARCTIGRSTSAEIQIGDDPQVSRVHAALERVGGQWTVVDGGLSRNGTFVNGERLAGRVRLLDRDRIRVGGTLLTFCSPQPTGTQRTIADVLPDAVRLTGAQRAVLAALSRPYAGGGHYATPATNQQIADELVLSIDAVKTHLRVLFHKFGIEDVPQNQKRARLVELAIERDLVPGTR